jgi:hypothetical protein
MPDAPDPKRLEDLDKAIAEVKEELQDLDSTAADERTFIEDGARSPDSEVDNTIVPPG